MIIFYLFGTFSLFLKKLKLLQILFYMDFLNDVFNINFRLSLER